MAYSELAASGHVSLFSSSGSRSDQRCGSLLASTGGSVEARLTMMTLSN
jgi:hypothetical protein